MPSCIPTAHLPHDKNQLRHALIHRRAKIGEEERAVWDMAIAKHVDELLRACSATSVAVYWPIRSEPDLRSLYAKWAEKGMQLALPIVIDKNAPLKFCAWQPGEALSRDTMGVMVPANACHVQPDVVLVPCVGFNPARIRLGYGGGFYDRTLALPTKPLAIGIAYSCTEADFPAEQHDIALDWIVTERTTLPAQEPAQG